MGKAESESEGLEEGGESEGKGERESGRRGEGGRERARGLYVEQVDNHDEKE